jgi:hypothetical protein
MYIPTFEVEFTYEFFKSFLSMNRYWVYFYYNNKPVFICKTGMINPCNEEWIMSHSDKCYFISRECSELYQYICNINEETFNKFFKLKSSNTISNNFILGLEDDENKENIVYMPVRLNYGEHTLFLKVNISEDVYSYLKLREILREN